MSSIGRFVDLLRGRFRTIRQRIPSPVKQPSSTEDFKTRVTKFVTEVTGEKPGDWHLYALALTHSSYAGAVTGKQNERLEYLGDSLLGAIIAASVYRLYPEEDEGGLTQLRSFLSSRKQINKLARYMGIDRILRVSQGVDLEHSDVTGNALEAFIGALYLDKGFEVTSDFVRKQVVISRKNLDTVSRSEEDYKSSFIIQMQRDRTPYLFDYIGETEETPGEVRHHVALKAGAPLQILAEGSGPSKKSADQDAARQALEQMRQTE